MEGAQPLPIVRCYVRKYLANRVSRHQPAVTIKAPSVILYALPGTSLSSGRERPPRRSKRGSRPVLSQVPAGRKRPGIQNKQQPIWNVPLLRAPPLAVRLRGIGKAPGQFLRNQSAPR